MLARRFAKVRVLLSDPGRACSATATASCRWAAGSRAVIDIRNVSAEYRGNPCAFLIADDRAIVYRQQASRWDGIVDFNDATVVRRYLDVFDEIWDASVTQPELRATAIDF